MNGINDNYKWLDLIPMGWIELARKVIEKCEAIDSTYTIEDMKEKWGCLDIYSYHYGDSKQNRAINQIEKEAQKQSSLTCCRCGAPATKYSTGWVLPWCDKCGREEYGPYKEFNHDSTTTNNN